MTSPEQKRPTPQEAAQQVYSTFTLLVQRGHALVRQRTTIPHPDIEGQRLLATVRPLIALSEASPYYKRKIDAEMYNADGTYRGGPYMDSAAMYFGIYRPEDIGIFDKDEAASFEAMGMLQEARLLMMQAELDPNTFTLAMGAAREVKDKLKQWVQSYGAHYGETILDFLQGAIDAASPEVKPHLEQDVKRLGVLLRDYTEEE